MEFEEISEQPAAFAGLKDKITTLFTRLKGKDDADQAQFTELGELISQLTDAVGNTVDANALAKTDLKNLSDKHAALETKVTDLTAALNRTADHSQQQRPLTTGGDGSVLTQF